MTVETPVTEAEFADLLASFTRSAFRFEAQPAYAIGEELPDFEDFLAGHPTPPPDLDWWAGWLDQVAAWTAEGKTVSRVRILAEPPTPYQRWQLWASAWHTDAGERIRYLARGRAEALGLPATRDWWLLDEKRLILMEFTPAGELGAKTLITDPETITTYLTWRDRAFRHAAPAEQVAAA